jgi:hypothetical protein
MAIQAQVKPVTTGIQTLEADYYRLKDVLYLRILPHRPARLREVAEDFYVCTNTAEPGEVVGFEIHYFSLLEPSDLAVSVLQPYLDMRFDLVDSELKDATLRQILVWARRLAKKGLAGT